MKEKTKWKMTDLTVIVSCIFFWAVGMNAALAYDAANVENALANGWITEDEAYLDITMGTLSVSDIQTMINDGYLSGYVEQIQALGYSVTPKATSTPTPEPTQPAEQPSTPASTNKGTSTKKPDTTETAVVEEPKEPEITEDTAVTGLYVAIADATIKETYAEDAEEAGTLTIGTEVDVLAKTSNNLYKISGGYVEIGALATKEAYEAAWEETERAEATCTETGKVTYTNALSMKTKAEELEALGHKAGKWNVTKKAALFKNGEKEKTCNVCGEVLETEEIPQTCPLALWQVITIGVAVVAAIAGAITFIVLKKKQR